MRLTDENLKFTLRLEKGLSWGHIRAYKASPGHLSNAEETGPEFPRQIRTCYQDLLFKVLFDKWSCAWTRKLLIPVS